MVDGDGVCSDGCQRFVETREGISEKSRKLDTTTFGRGLCGPSSVRHTRFGNVRNVSMYCARVLNLVGVACKFPSGGNYMGNARSLTWKMYVRMSPPRVGRQGPAYACG